ncbi:hypothetical protein M407DRAFT_31372 [Tulasnella calospora MUT 4182]|uniref:Dipeptidase n=1 Tax=Tulasnella calospora MUT 4182 TaxID=1051891 RepID=A0A0C3KBZ9_9AGAM|nr:hypothetical protein M407DRAFT_31372 [Tulasnella calospora MUT 4182]
MEENMPDPEHQRLLNANGSTHDQSHLEYQASARRKFLGSTTVVFFLILAAVSIFGWHERKLPSDPQEAVDLILSRTGVIDGHIDLPWAVRDLYRYNISAFDLEKSTPGHVDIPRLRKGHTAGFFWSAFVPCPDWPDHQAEATKDWDDFTGPNWRVRDTLEQIDDVRELIAKYWDTFRLATTSNDVEASMHEGRIASLIGIEGGHQLGNSLAVLRMYYALGARYMTLTHMCHNAFADSGGYLWPLPPRHHGLSEFGRTLIHEMNRLGMIVDLSHTSDETAAQAILESEAPVMWSHSSARSLWNVARNVPDHILAMISEEKKDAVVMVNFSADFIAGEGNATVEAVADHVEHIVKIAGKRHVGIGSDFDGIEKTPVGLEDTSKYPNLFVELYKRGWKPNELEDLAGRNFLRIFKKVEKVASKIQREGGLPSLDIYSARKDL